MSRDRFSWVVIGFVVCVVVFIIITIIVAIINTVTFCDKIVIIVVTFDNVANHVVVIDYVNHTSVIINNHLLTQLFLLAHNLYPLATTIFVPLLIVQLQ